MPIGANAAIERLPEANRGLQGLENCGFQLSSSARAPEEQTDSGLANIALTAILAGQIGLGIDSWTFAPDDSVHARPRGLAFDGARDCTEVRWPYGRRLRPAVDASCGKIYASLPRSWWPRLANLDQLFGMEIFDIWLQLGSARQVVFVAEASSLRALFLDNLHGFGLEKHTGGKRAPPEWLGSDFEYYEHAPREWIDGQLARWTAALRRLAPAFVEAAMDDISPLWVPPLWRERVLGWARERSVADTVAEFVQSRRPWPVRTPWPRLRRDPAPGQDRDR